MAEHHEFSETPDLVDVGELRHEVQAKYAAVGGAGGDQEPADRIGGREEAVMARTPDAVVLTAPDGCTKYLLAAVERSLADMAPQAVLEVPCDSMSRLDLAEWCLRGGRRIVNPFDHWERAALWIENTSAAEAA
jgi:hypothetical protein